VITENCRKLYFTLNVQDDEQAGKGMNELEVSRHVVIFAGLKIN
jgi:hypothetical protein